MTDKEFFLSSPKGVIQMDKELEHIYVALKNQETWFNEIVNLRASFRKLASHDWHYDLLCNRYSLIFEFNRHYGNSTDKSQLTISIFSGYFTNEGTQDAFYPAKPKKIARYFFDADAGLCGGWSDQEHPHIFMKTPSLCDYWFELFNQFVLNKQ